MKITLLDLQILLGCAQTVLKVINKDNGSGFHRETIIEVYEKIINEMQKVDLEIKDTE